MDTLNIEQAILEARQDRWDKIIAKAMAFAEDNYSNGMDYFIECYERSDWLEYIANDDGSLKKWSEVKAEMREDAHSRIEQTLDICGYGDCQDETIYGYTYNQSTQSWER